MVIGSGYTGLNAALQFARGGPLTRRDRCGGGRLGLQHPQRRAGRHQRQAEPRRAVGTVYGEQRADAILAEGRASLAWLGEFIGAEGIECDFRVSGRFHAAHSRRAYEGLALQADESTCRPDSDVELIRPGEQRREIGSDIYHGGIVYRRHAALDPARYHRGLLDRALAAGAEMAPLTRRLEIEPSGGEFRVATDRGEIDARDVIVATNGYSGRASPWLQRRVIPIGSYIIATEPIARGMMDEILPTDRMVTDTRKVVYYYRASPDRTRILFGGRVS